MKSPTLKRLATLMVAGLVLSSASFADGDTPVIGREQVNATLWMQRATEYRIAATQVYRLATERLGRTLAAPGSAAIEQQQADQATLERLPTAIIVDLDETVLDNTFYQARRIRAGGDYDEPSWQAWMQEAAATAIPGAVEFLQAA
ncbi:MAG: acid phosphatase, partial [Gammaproteobacteria bacterium]|nr:acid phosphatase [Gammaproteobacteria bacterium]